MIHQEDIFIQHMKDLADRSWQRGIPLYTNFLSLHELHILRSLRPEMPGIILHFDGGFASAERQVAVFMPDALSFTGEFSYPISCIRIRFRSGKFSDRLTHRDVLGALLSTGIDRSKIGDILLGEMDGCFFCITSMADLLCREVTSIKHTQVELEIWNSPKPDLFQPREIPVSAVVASLRPDVLIAAAFGIPRSKASSLLADSRVFVNSVLIMGNGYKVKEEDLFSVRGLGRFRYLSCLGKTRKDKLHVQIIRYG